MADTREGLEAFGDVLAVAATALFALVGAIWFFGSSDPAMSFHGLLMLVGSLIAGIYILNVAFREKAARAIGNYEPPEGYFDGPIKVATVAAVIWGIAGFLVGWS